MVIYLSEQWAHSEDGTRLSLQAEATSCLAQDRVAVSGPENHPPAPTPTPRSCFLLLLLSSSKILEVRNDHSL